MVNKLHTQTHGLIYFSLVLQNWVPQIHILFWQQPWLQSPNLGRLAGSCCGGEESWREMELCQKCSSSAASFHDLEWKYIDWLLCLQLSKVNLYARHSIHAAPVPHHFCSFLNGSFICIVCKHVSSWESFVLSQSQHQLAVAENTSLTAGLIVQVCRGSNNTELCVKKLTTGWMGRTHY